MVRCILPVKHPLPLSKNIVRPASACMFRNEQSCSSRTICWVETQRLLSESGGKLLKRAAMAQGKQHCLGVTHLHSIPVMAGTWCTGSGVSTQYWCKIRGNIDSEQTRNSSTSPFPIQERSWKLLYYLRRILSVVLCLTWRYSVWCSLQTNYKADLQGKSLYVYSWQKFSRFVIGDIIPIKG